MDSDLPISSYERANIFLFKSDSQKDYAPQVRLNQIMTEHFLSLRHSS